MRLADDEITIRIGQETVHLRPTLRAAFRLERRYGGFDKVIKAILDGSLTVIADVIAESSDRWSGIPDLLKAFDAAPLKSSVECLSVPVLNHVFALVGLNDDSNATD